METFTGLKLPYKWCAQFKVSCHPTKANFRSSSAKPAQPTPTNVLSQHCAVLTPLTPTRIFLLPWPAHPWTEQPPHPAKLASPLPSCQPSPASSPAHPPWFTYLGAPAQTPLGSRTQLRFRPLKVSHLTYIRSFKYLFMPYTTPRGLPHLYFDCNIPYFYNGNICKLMINVISLSTNCLYYHSLYFIELESKHAFKMWVENSHQSWEKSWITTLEQSVASKHNSRNMISPFKDEIW